MTGPPTIAPGSHLYVVLAREYWRCSGLAANAEQDAKNAADVARQFRAEFDKWEARLAEILALFGGVPPTNPLPGSDDG